MLAALFDVERWLDKGGILLLALIVFAESGLLIGFFLPGDTLLFVAGFLSSDGGDNLLPPLWVTAGVVFLAAVLGDQVGYLFGQRVGPSLFQRERGRVFKPDHIERAHEFFDRRGPFAIVLARFVPVVRTLTPIVAGVARMRYRTFVTYNVIGGLLWGVGVTTLGYFLGNIEFMKDNLEYVAIVVLLISVAPIAIEYLKHRREVAAATTSSSTSDPTSS